MDWRKLPVLENRKLVFEDTETPPRPGAIVPCLLCRKPFLMPMFIGEPDQLCPDCKEVYGEAARVICVKCRVSICRLLPKILDNGYYIRPRSVLHSDACNVCQPGLNASSIIEIEQWEKTRRTPKVIVPFGSARS